MTNSDMLEFNRGVSLLVTAMNFVHNLLIDSFCDLNKTKQMSKLRLWLTFSTGSHSVSHLNSILSIYLQGHKVFAWYDGKLSAADYYVGRVNLLENSYGYGRASVNLTSIRETDAGWYECRVIFPNRTPSTRNNGKTLLCVYI